MTVIIIPHLIVSFLRNESLRLGFLLSQGGEFAFVLLSLANTLRVLPEDLNQVRWHGKALAL